MSQASTNISTHQKSKQRRKPHPDLHQNRKRYNSLPIKNRILSVGRKGNPPKFSHISTGRKLAILAMHQAGISTRDISISEKIHQVSVTQIIRDLDPRELDPKIVESTKNALSSKLVNLADKSIDVAAQDDRLDKLSSLQLTTVAGIAIDKARLLEGLSTQNVSVRGTIAEAQSSIAGLAELKKRLIESLGDA